jgi:hypothetical protein
MALKSDYIWLLDSFPVAPVVPVVPAKSPRRKVHVQKRIRGFLFRQPRTNGPSTLSKSQQILEEIDRELEDTQESLTSAIVSSKMRGAWASDRVKNEATKEVDYATGKMRDADACTIKEFFQSETRGGTGAEVSDRLSTNFSASSSMYSRLTTGERPQSAVSDHGTTNAMVHGRDRAVHADTPTTIWSDEGDEPPCPSSHCSVEQDDIDEAEAWLLQGLPVQVREAEERFSRDWSRTSDGNHHSLSPFPPISSTTGFREYEPPISSFMRLVHPVSPLNNGRDIYGNQIPSHTPDYFTTPSLPTSPILQAVLHDKDRPQVALRGGWEFPWKHDKVRNTAQQVPSASGLGRDDNIQFLPPNPINEAEIRLRASNRSVASIRSQYSAAQLVAIHNGEPNSKLREGPQHVPIGPGIRPLTNQETSYGREDIPTRGKPRSPPPDIPLVSPNSRSALLSHGTSVYIQQRPEVSSPPSSTVAVNTVQRRDIARRSGRIWDKDLPPEPSSRVRPGRPDEYSALFSLKEDDEPDDLSAFSEYAASDMKSELQSLNERLYTSGPYQDYQRRLRARIGLEEDIRRQEEELQWQELERKRLERLHAQDDGLSDVHTIHPDDSVSHIGNAPPRRAPIRPRMSPINENGSFGSSPRFTSDRHSSVAPVATLVPKPLSLASATVPQTAARDKSKKHSVKTAAHLAGKLSRLLLAAPSDPNQKTYSDRHPPKDAKPRATHTLNLSGATAVDTASTWAGQDHVRAPQTVHSATPRVAVPSAVGSGMTSDTRWPEPITGPGGNDWTVPASSRPARLRGGGAGEHARTNISPYDEGKQAKLSKSTLKVEDVGPSASTESRFSMASSISGTGEVEAEKKKKDKKKKKKREREWIWANQSLAMGMHTHMHMHIG